MRCRNRRSIWSETMVLQGFEPVGKVLSDPLLNRTIGVAIQRKRFTKVNEIGLKSSIAWKRLVLPIELCHPDVSSQLSEIKYDLVAGHGKLEGSHIHIHEREPRSVGRKNFESRSEWTFCYRI